MKNSFRWFLTAVALLTVAASAACTASPTPTPTPQPTPTPTVAPAPTTTPVPTKPTATPVPPIPMATVNPPQSIDGRWEGTAQVLGTELQVALDIVSNDTGLAATIDIPEQGVEGLALSNVSYNPPGVHFEIDLGQVSAVFEGEAQGETISGEFQQNGVAGRFKLNRMGPVVESSPTEVSTPYREEEVTFRNGDITLAGTLTLPPVDGPHPAVVLITGSGPQNRDEELYGFKIFGVIADHFTRRGIAVLRYDDRGVGGSTGDVDQATSKDFAQDVVAAVELLQTRHDINGSQIGLVGHSEGGIVAPLAAVEFEDVSFIILMAGPGLPGHQALQSQLELMAPTEGLSEAEMAERREVQERAFEAARTGEGFEDLEADLRQQILKSLERLPEEERQAITDMDQLVEARVQLSLQALQTPWFTFFLDYDPAATLERVTVPVLAVFGGQDLQVPAEVHRPAIKQALDIAGNQDVTSVTLPRANHLFQEAESGSPGEYATLDKEFVPGFLDLMTKWILDRVDVAVGVSQDNIG
jgi:pimeloyl-ACP methyl ester carboxylesterase